MNGLTDCQRRTLEFIDRVVAALAEAPSLQEIAAHFNISRQAAHYRLDPLIRRGYLAADALSANGSRSQRALRLTDLARTEIHSRSASPEASAPRIAMHPYRRGIFAEVAPACATCESPARLKWLGPVTTDAGGVLRRVESAFMAGGAS